jgi:phosphoglycolate phosphatase
MYKLIIFDIDDTLIHFKEPGVKAYQKIACRLNLPVYPKNKIAKLFGLPWNKVAKTLWPKVDLKKFKKLHDEEILKIESKPIRGAKNLLKKLKRQKFILGIVTTKIKPELLNALKSAKINPKLFDYIQTMEDTKYHKPDGRVFLPLLKFAQKKKIKKSEILFVGDSAYDALAAKNAKIPFIAVTTGSTTKEDFKKIGIKEKQILRSIVKLVK